MIIGLTGKNAAGKGEAAAHLGRRGFSLFSLSDELREEATRQGLPHGRETMIRLGTQLRSKHGAGYLASKINEKIMALRKQGKSDFVIDSIRSPGEVKELQKNKDFTLVGIEANPELRFERMKKRGRGGDASTFEEFNSHEQKENTSNASGQQLDACLSMAQKKVENNGTLDELYKKMDKVAGGF
ncbi:MAG: hypothetical protein A2Z88_08940 [Omnitrophica WOR_2 bacterium GWA2_47_8]|nr:MAG: hypothetical protein A2Z88_08940 [Omnitrophica WOR_2 bacterium GWA2_47_8]